MTVVESSGHGASAALQAQRAYVETLDAAGFRFGLTVPEAFVRGIRDLGYRSNAAALAELVDNAIQALAERVDVLFGYEGARSEKKPTQVAVIDDGHGMEPGMIRLAVMWGGTHRENDRRGLGRYGYGLPCSSVSIGRRFTVYSRTLESELHSITIDLDAISAGAYSVGRGEIVVPPPQPAALPPFVAEHVAAVYPEGWRCGTVVVIEQLDRLEWSTTLGLRENLIREFGVTYHKLRTDVALYVDGMFVDPIDPLFASPGYALFDVDEDRAIPLKPVRIEVRSPETNAVEGVILLRFVWLPPSFGSIDKRRDAVGINANGRFPVMKDFHGVIFSRMGRLIDVQTRTPWTTFINNDRYIKVEVEFSASLDDAFGVTTSKQQVTVSPAMWDRLREHGLPKAIEQLRAKVKEAKLERRGAILTPPAGAGRVSETAMATLSRFSTDPEQMSLPLRPRGYRMEIDHRPGGPFFWVGRDGAQQVLHLNGAHRFFQDLYDGPGSTPELRSALEVLLFCIGDTILAADEAARAGHEETVRSWSRRLEDALAMLEEHIGLREEDELSDLTWR
jgi:hypothetical protein